MHAPCGSEDKNSTSIATNLTCFICAPENEACHQAEEEDGAKKPAARGGKKNVVMRKPPDTELQDEGKNAQSPAKNTRSATRLHSPPAKSTRRSSSSPAQQSKRKRKNVPSTAGKKKSSDPSKKMKKTTQQKSFTLTSDKRKPDPLYLKRVAFDVDDNGDGSNLLRHFGGKDVISGSLSNGRYLLGTISRLSKNKKNPVCYVVDWEDPTLGDTTIELPVLIPAIELSERLKAMPKSASTSASIISVQRRQRDQLGVTRRLFGSKVHDILIQPDEGDEGTPDNSDVEANDPYVLPDDYDSDDDATTEAKSSSEADDFHLEDMRKYVCQMPFLSSPIEGNNDTIRQSNRFRWSSEATLRPPSGLSHRGKSSVRPELASCFSTPMSSFLAFVPPKIFKSIAIFSNAYAHKCMEESGRHKIAGGRWVHDISFSEIMQFFGILFHMVLRPTPGNSYTVCWNDQQWHPYTAYMSLRRFQQIRSVLHFNEIVNPTATQVKDALFKIRPLLNVLKITFPSYLRLGDEFALDEASVASRSRYGADVIFYNPTKPGGKYHFRFYLLCCSTTYACIRLRMHTKNNTDFGDGFFEQDQPQQVEEHDEEKDDDTTTEQTQENRVEEDSAVLTPKNTTTDQAGPVIKKLVSLVLDMCKPLFGTGCVVNMDNYYTSPEAAIALKEKGVFMRGTCRTNRFGFPGAVRFTNTEASNQGRGAIKRMVDVNNHLAAYGWVDGNPVHFLTSADSTSSTEVKRRVGKQIARVTAPKAIKRYNKNMHAVDRHDQLRDTFSLSKRHGFKKYYIKIAMGLIDMAVVNAWLHYKLVNKDKCNKDLARYDFMKLLADSLLVTDWGKYNESASAKDNERIFRSLFASNTPNSPDGNEEEAEDECQTVGGDSSFDVRQGICTPVSVWNFLKTRNRSKKKGFSCQVCAFEGRGQAQTRDVVICTQHRLRLCTVVRDDKPVTLLDSGGNEVVDTSWRAPDGISCWQKAHDFYIPNGLFLDMIAPFTEEEMEAVGSGQGIKFQKVRTGCDVYKKKHKALGTYGRNQGRKNQGREKSGRGSVRAKQKQKRNRRLLEGGAEKTRVEDVEMRILRKDDESVLTDSSVSASIAELRRDPQMLLPPAFLDEESNYESAIQGGETAEI